MSDIKGQLIKDSYNYVLQSDLITGIVYRIGGDVPTNPKFVSGLTVNANFTYSDGTEFPGYVLTCDSAGNAVWGPVSGVTSGVVVTGGTFDYSAGTLTLVLSNGVNVPISGLEDIYVTGGVVSGNSIVFSYNDINTFQVTGITPYNLFSSYTASTQVTINNKLDTSGFTAYTATTQPLILNSVTGGTYYNGTLNLINNSGATIPITGFTTGGSSTTDSYVTGFTLDNETITLSQNRIDQYSAFNISLSGYVTNNIFSSYTASTQSTINNKLDTSGFTSYTATTQPLILNSVTGGTFSGGTLYLINNSGSTIPISGFTTGGTSTTDTYVTGFTLSANTITLSQNRTDSYSSFTISLSAYTGSSVSGAYLPLSGGTVTGGTTFQSGLTANTISATTYYNLPIPTLQEVTDVGNTTTNNIVLQNTAEAQFGVGGGILLANSARLREGTTDGLLGGAKGIAQICSNAYELKWEAGRLYVMEQDGFTIREVRYQFNIKPVGTDDVDKGYVIGSRWVLDNGDLYVCSDNSQGAADWVAQTICDELADCAVITGLTGDVQTIFSSITGTPNQVAYYNINGNLTGDTSFTRLDETNNFTTVIGSVNYLNPAEHQDSQFEYNLVRDRVFNDDIALVAETNLSPTGYYNIINNTTGNTYSGLDILETTGTFRYTYSAGTYNGFFYNDQQPGFSVEKNGSQYNYFLPKSAFVTGGTLTDVNGNGNLSWVVPTDTFVTGGTYTNGNTVFTNNKGGGFTVTGYATGGGSGQLFYLNISQSKNGNRYLSTTASTAAEQSTGVTIGSNSTGTIASFQSDQLNITLIPGGVWAFYLHSYKQNNNASFDIFVEVYKRTSGGTETLLFTTDPAPVTSNSPNITMELTDAYFSGCPLVITDSIITKVRANNTSNQSHVVTLFSEGSQHYSYAVSSIPTQQGLTCETLSECSIIQTIQTNISNKFDKTGGTISGDTIIQSGLTATTISATTYQNLPTTISAGTKFVSGLTANTLNISTSPTLNNSTTQLLSRNSSSGNVEYTDAAQYLNNTSTNQIYGSGFDGDIVMDGTNTYTTFTTKVSSVYTLTRSIYANNLTLSTSAVLDPNGFGIFVKGTLTIGGTSVIRSNGNTGNAAAAGVAGTGGATRAAAASNYIIMNTGAAGGTGGNSSGAGGSITVGVNYVGGIGGSGGFGYPTGNSGVGMPFTRPVVTVTAGILQQPYSNNYLSHSLYFGSIQMYCAHSGAGGQGGINAGGAIQGAGGGGGSSPRAVVIIANTIVMSAGTAGIQSTGGNGGAGGDASGANGTGGGGGGAGGGGFIYIITNTLTYTPANRITAAGGLGGLGGLCVGTVNTQNVAGLRSQSGSAGVNGYVVIINPVSGTNVTTTGSY